MSASATRRLRPSPASDAKAMFAKLSRILVSPANWTGLALAILVLC
jgi:hypothetical protein